MSIETDARHEAEQRWHGTWEHAAMRSAFVAGVLWSREQDNREPSDAEACLVCERTGGTHKMSCRPQNRADAERHRSDAEVEAAARAAYDRAFLKHAPEGVDRWDDLVVDNDEAAESWREVARAALLAAQEVRRG